MTTPIQNISQSAPLDLVRPSGTPTPSASQSRSRLLAPGPGLSDPAPSAPAPQSSSARLAPLGMLLSVVLHALITFTAMFVGIGGGSGGDGARAGSASRSAPAEFNLTPEVQLTDAGPVVLDVKAPAVNAVGVPELGTEGPLTGAGGFDEPTTGSGLGSIGDELGGSGGGGLGDGQGLGGGGLGGGASFFGIEAKGNRFLYICDISGSMGESGGTLGGTRLLALKNELTESLRGLLDSMSFSVIWFNSGAVPMIPDKSWTLATANGKRQALDLIGAVASFGGTQPWGAFEIAMSTTPPPDAIYFMTDGVFDADVAFRIAARNSGARKIPIHCITLVERSGEEVMRKIAAESGGTYRHVGGP